MLQFEHRSLQKSDMRELLKKDYHKWPGYAILYIQVREILELFQSNNFF